MSWGSGKVRPPKIKIRKKDMVMPQMETVGVSMYDRGAMILGVPQIHEKYNLRGEGIRVGVIDDGFTSHHNLPDPLYVKAVGFDSTHSERGHGNYVMGINGMQGRPYMGMLPEAEYVIFKFMGMSGGTLDMLEESIRRAREFGCDIINISAGVDPKRYHEGVHKELRKCYEFGIPVHVSVGNEGAKRATFPGNQPEVMGVGAIDFDKKVAIFQNRGKLDMVSFGVGVISTNNEDGHDEVDGTSFASPYTVGCGGILMQLFKRVHGRKPTVNEYGYILREYADDLTDIDGWDSDTGHGVVTLNFVKDEFRGIDLDEVPTENIWTGVESRIEEMRRRSGCLGWLKKYLK